MWPEQLDYDAADCYLGIPLAAAPARRPSYGVGFANGANATARIRDRMLIAVHGLALRKARRCQAPLNAVVEPGVLSHTTP